jgi:hypothetical protein
LKKIEETEEIALARRFSRQALRFPSSVSLSPVRGLVGVVVAGAGAVGVVDGAGGALAWAALSA